MNRGFLRQAQHLQARLARLQQELAGMEVSATAGGGAVRAVVTGSLRLKDLQIDPSAVDPQETGLLAEMVMAAVNEALQKAQEMAQKRMTELTGGMGLPGR